MKKFIAETYQRATSESPEYFKPIQKVGLGAAGLGVAIKVACLFFPATMPIGLAAIGVDLFSVGLAIFGVAKLPVNGVFSKK